MEHKKNTSGHNIVRKCLKIQLNQQKISHFCSYSTTSALLLIPGSSYMARLKAINTLSKNFKWNTKKLLLMGAIIRKCLIFWLNQSKNTDFCTDSATSSPLLNLRSFFLAQLKVISTLNKNFKRNKIISTSGRCKLRKCLKLCLNQSKIII